MTTLGRSPLLRGAAALAGACALSGCFMMESDVPALPPEAILAEAPMTLGIYCQADLAFDDEGALEDITIEDCFRARFEDAALVFDPEDPDEENGGALALSLAPGPRASTLLQAWSDEENEYQVFTGVFADEAFAILPPPVLSEATIARAAGLAVTLDLDEPGLDSGDMNVGDDIHVLAGDADNIYALMSGAVGLAFDAALRDEGPFADYRVDSIFYVHADWDGSLEDAPDVVEADQDDLRAKFEPVLTRIARSITLE